MSPRKIRSLIIMAVAAQGIAVSPLMADPSLQDITDKMNTLQTEMNQLKAQQQQAVVDQQKQDVMQGALEDADTRLSFMGDGATAGYKNRRFFIASEDGNFVLRPWIHIQIRNTTNIRENSTGTGAADEGSNDVENGFELRRARLGFDGNIGSPDLTYFINWATYRASSSQTVYDSKTGAAVKDTAGNSETVDMNTGGLPVLEEAWIKYHFADTPWYVKFGQMHDPLDHENIVGSKYRAPEASLQGDLMGNTDTFTQGATAIYDPKSWVRVEAGPTDGIYAANTSFQDPELNNWIYYNWGIAGRAEFKLMGNWKDYDQMTSLNDQDDLLVLGLGSDYSQGDSQGGVSFGQFSQVADLTYASTQGLFFHTAYFGRYITNNPGIPLGAPVSASFGGGTPEGFEQHTYEPSIMAYVSYLVTPKIEPFARYEYLHLQGTPTGSNNNVHEVSLGANYYMWGHNAKFTTQFMYLPNGIPVADTSSDVLLSNDHQEFIMMLQFQLLI